MNVHSVKRRAAARLAGGPRSGDNGAWGASRAATALAVEEIWRASRRIAGLAVRTPLLSARRLGARAGLRLYLKAENLQRTGSFKLRGASNKLARLRASGRPVAGVVTASSGNHGQAVAFAARAYGVPAVVVVPEGATAQKVEAARDFGAEIVVCGQTSRERLARAAELARERGFAFVPPYDDLDVVAGQGTVGLEIADELPEVEAVLVPLGGGGLAAGVASALRARLPRVRLVGVEPEGSCAHYLSRGAGRRVELAATDTVADGLRKLAPGELTHPIVQALLDEIVLVSDDEILEAMRYLATDAKLVAEPSGAVTVAAALAGRGVRPGETVVAVVSGGNADPAVLARAFAGRTEAARGDRASPL
ncbi:MAG: threonine/serine dehydratase [Clostridia bacterium]|nr:threonine/serine dehydratase [Clostridia bacterium]